MSIWIPESCRKPPEEIKPDLDLSDVLSQKALYQMIVVDWMYQSEPGTDYAGPPETKTIGITFQGDGIFFHPSMKQEYRARVLRYVAKRLLEAANAKEKP